MAGAHPLGRVGVVADLVGPRTVGVIAVDTVGLP
ncbi:MAG: hypothetical protein QOE23_1205, partial [Pseudonocardiales bacterium]|nr:hypothetical protein [Pseudonocardiales bacterium]